MTKMLAIDSLRFDAATECRDGQDEEAIVRYAEAMSDGERFPPVVAFHDGTDYHLADGAKRAVAAQSAGLAEIEADVRDGGLRDAILYAASANLGHGLVSSQADKRRAVAAVLRVASNLSDRDIGRRCGVTHPTVSGIRQELTGKIYQSPLRTGADGRTIDTSKIGVKPDGSLTSEDEAELHQHEGSLTEFITRVGGALAKIRDLELYREQYRTFEAYLDGKYGDQADNLREYLTSHDHLVASEI